MTNEHSQYKLHGNPDMEMQNNNDEIIHKNKCGRNGQDAAHEV